MSFIIGSLIATAANSVLGAVSGAIKMGSARKDMRYYTDKINNFERQELTNPYRDLTVPTKHSELAQEEMARTTAQAMGSAGLSGSRGLAALSSQILNTQYKTQNDIAAYYDDQQSKIDQMIAQDDTAIRGIQENRDNMELAGLQRGLESATQNYNTGRDQLFGAAQSGLSTAAGIAGQAAQMGMWNNLFGSREAPFDVEKMTEKVNPLQSGYNIPQIPTKLGK